MQHRQAGNCAHVDDRQHMPGPRMAFWVWLKAECYANSSWDGGHNLTSTGFYTNGARYAAMVSAN